MCLTCKSTVMVVTNHTSICKVANTKSPQLEYVAHILLFAIFFHLRFIFSRNILHETYIQKHKRPIFFWVIEVKMHFFWQFALFKFLKMFHIIVIFPQINKPLQVLETIVQNYQNVFGDQDLYRKYTIVCIRIICFFWEKFCKKKYVPYTKRIALLKKNNLSK